ncbi:MAG TPA: hypothetical protein VKE69_11060 [Planctomycetota bacterium]|nr:hypothetical protein [Planctomycetota bacterium]
MTTPLRRDAFYVSTDDLAEQLACEQRSLFRAMANEKALEESFRGQRGEETPRGEPETITLLPPETEALRAIGAVLKARQWREIFVAPARMLSIAAFRAAAKKAKVDPALAKELASKLGAARAAGEFHLRVVEESPALFRLYDEARSGDRHAQSKLDSILGAADARPHRGIFKFRLLRVAAAAEIGRTVVVESRVAADEAEAATLLPVARARANLNAYVFKRPRWRVDIKVAAGDGKIAESGETKNALALDVLKRLVAFLRKEAEPAAPHPSMCPPCDYKSRCSIYKRMKRWRWRGGREEGQRAT